MIYDALSIFFRDVEKKNATKSVVKCDELICVVMCSNLTGDISNNNCVCMWLETYYTLRKISTLKGSSFVPLREP